MAGDSDCLFASTASGKRSGEEQTPEKRKMLRRYDHLASQALNPFGVSELEKASLAQIWGLIKQGNKGTDYFAEWADADKYRKGIAVSRLAQVLTTAIQILEDTKFRTLLEKTIYDKAMEEAKSMKPYLELLNCGKASQTARKITMSSLGQTETAAKSENDVREAAKRIYNWLEEKNSTLRGLLSFLSQGGVFYAASCAEKGARSYIKHGGDSIKTFEDSAIARLCRPAEDCEIPDDTSCLFIKVEDPKPKK